MKSTCSGAWTQARIPIGADVMLLAKGLRLLAKGLRLGSPQDWPLCLRLCGIVPDKVVRTRGMDQIAVGASAAVPTVPTCTASHQAGCSCPRRNWSPRGGNCTNWRKQGANAMNAMPMP